MAKVAVFASGRGSNFIAIHEYLKSLSGSHTICCLVSDKPSCGAVKYAQDHKIPILILSYSKDRTRDSVEGDLLQDLGKFDPQLIVLAGFMRLLGKTLIDGFPRKIVNIHPSLLPKYPGVHGIEESFNSEDKTLGITIHFVDYGMDTGPIVLQKSFERNGHESLDALTHRIHELEHATYPMVVGSLLDRVSP